MQKTLAAALAVCAAPALADGDVVTYETDLPYGAVAFGLENGLVIDHVSDVGGMLSRTRADVGSDVVLYEAAEAYGFCSATVSRAVMEADPMNIAYCPYHVFIMQEAGAETVTIGYRGYPDGAMDQVEALLDRIARNAVGLE